MRRQNLTKLITIIFCIALAFAGGIYQYSHSKEVSRNSGKQEETKNELLKETKDNNGISNNNDEESQEVEEGYQDEINLNSSDKISFSESELGENSEKVVNETADGYYSNDIIGIDNLEALSNVIDDIESYQLKYQIKSYLVLSGYDDIYQIKINEDSVIQNEDGYSFNSQITDTEILNVTCIQEESKYIFKISN